MKRFTIWVTMLCAGVCLAGDMQTSPPVQLTNISVLSTNWSSVTRGLGANGRIEALMIGVTNSMAAGTNSVSLHVQIGDDMGIWRDVYTNTAITASTVAYPYTTAQNIYGVATNLTIRIPEYASMVKVSAYNAGLSTNCNVRTWFLISNPQ